MTSLPIFLGAFLIEISAVLWTHSAERNRPWSLAACSALQATALLSLTQCTTWLDRAVFVGGYAVGAVAGLRLKRVMGLVR